MLLQFCRENSNWVNIGQKYQAVYCHLVLLLGKAPLSKNTANTIAPERTVTSNGHLIAEGEN
jgi:hypothetical protein